MPFPQKQHFSKLVMLFDDRVDCVDHFLHWILFFYSKIVFDIHIMYFKLIFIDTLCKVT